jgi:hypothetical protein
MTACPPKKGPDPRRMGSGLREETKRCARRNPLTTSSAATATVASAATVLATRIPWARVAAGLLPGAAAAKTAATAARLSAAAAKLPRGFLSRSHLPRRLSPFAATAELTHRFLARRHLPGRFPTIATTAELAGRFLPRSHLSRRFSPFATASEWAHGFLSRSHVSGRPTTLAAAKSARKFLPWRYLPRRLRPFAAAAEPAWKVRTPVHFPRRVLTRLHARLSILGSRPLSHYRLRRPDRPSARIAKSLPAAVRRRLIPRCFLAVYFPARLRHPVRTGIPIDTSLDSRRAARRLTAWIAESPPTVDATLLTPVRRLCPDSLVDAALTTETLLHRALLLHERRSPHRCRTLLSDKRPGILPRVSRAVSCLAIRKTKVRAAWRDRHLATDQTRFSHLIARVPRHPIETATPEIALCHARDTIAHACISVSVVYVYVRNVNVSIESAAIKSASPPTIARFKRCQRHPADVAEAEPHSAATSKSKEGN